jgi:hypothetical protein
MEIIDACEKKPSAINTLIGADLGTHRFRRAVSAGGALIDIQLGRLTPMPELPRSGRMNLGRRFNAGAAIRHTLRHVGAA